MKGLLKELARRLIRAEKEGYRTHLAVLSLLRGVRAGSLLDVGCAEGRKAEAYAAALGLPLERAAGIEANPAYAAEAAKKIKVYSADIEREPLPLPEESFDLVVCNQVLEHLKNIYRPLRELDRVVKTGGHLLIGVPNLAGLYNRALLLAGRQPLCVALDGPHVRGFAHGTLLAFLRSNPNFTVEACAGSNLYPLPWPLLDLANGHFPGLSAFSFYLLKKVRHEPGACPWRAGAAADTVFS